jgi:aromatic-L-amino-acid/L-tryptophan decarboxylase
VQDNIKTPNQRVSPGPFDLEEREMRELGYKAIDILVDRWISLRDKDVWVGGTRSEMEEMFRESPPEEKSSAMEVMTQSVDEVLTRSARVDHPRFFAFVPSSPTWPSVIADALVSGFNVFQGTWLESAAPSQVELVVLDWFREWIGLPRSAGGILTSGGSAANLNALVLARGEIDHLDTAVVYLSDQGHSSLERAARIVGIQENNIRMIPTTKDYRIDLQLLNRAIQQDRNSGLRPMVICGNGGATNTGVVDPLEDLAEICEREKLWLHVDASYGGFSVLTEEGKRDLRGIHLADSVTLDPHKWLFQPYEVGCLLVKNLNLLESEFRVTPDYLQDMDLGLEHVNFCDRGLQLTRSARAFKVWMSVKTFGMKRFRMAIQNSLDLVKEAEAYIRKSNSLELLTSANLGIVCFRINPSGYDLDMKKLERLNNDVSDDIIESGYAMVSSTRLRGEFALRLCVMNHRARREDVLGVLKAMEETAQRLIL